ncbi:MAG: hypothetical protein ACLSTJ_08370 [Clostridium neonatale]
MYFEKNICINVNEIISDKHKFYAHLKEDSNFNEIIRKETLKEHTDLCVKYFYKVFNNKNLENIFLNFENNFFDSIVIMGKRSLENY